MTTDSLILNFFQRSRTDNSRIFKELKLVVLWKFKELLNTGVQLDHQAKNNVISSQFFSKNNSEYILIQEDRLPSIFHEMCQQSLLCYT
jgi:hypothetical protein